MEDEQDLPENILEVIELEFTDYKIKKVYEWTSMEGGTSFELEIQKASDKRTVHISEDGSIICD